MRKGREEQGLVHGLRGSCLVFGKEAVGLQENLSLVEDEHIASMFRVLRKQQ